MTFDDPILDAFLSPDEVGSGVVTGPEPNDPFIIFELAKFRGAGEAVADAWDDELGDTVPAAAALEKSAEAVRDLSKAASRPGMLRFVQDGDLTVAFDHEGSAIRTYAF